MKHISGVNLMKLISAKRGFLTFVIFFLIVFGLVGLYLGYNWYNTRYYIALFDDNMTRYLDVPPFCERISPASDELRGECILNVETSESQVKNFYKSMCARYGYVFKEMENGLQMDIRKDYVIKGAFKDNKLTLSWQPSLNEKQKKKAASLFKQEQK
jgi:hypothetical protein